VLSDEDTALLTPVGRGTPMGDLLRRHWLPVGAREPLTAEPVTPVRLLGEDLVLYRDGGGRTGLLGRHCPHRGADLSYGWVESQGLRCMYHGWRFDVDGRCLEQPYEDLVAPESRFKDKVRTAAYPVVAAAGLVWAYLGPQPAGPLPSLGPSVPDPVVTSIEIACHWLRCETDLGGSEQAAGKPGFPPGVTFLDGQVHWRVPIDEVRTLLVLWQPTGRPMPRWHAPSGPAAAPLASTPHLRRLLTDLRAVRAPRNREPAGAE
jgi:nitrite reductase/ring-hydroxylating ferredoxin subunit